MDTIDTMQGTLEFVVGSGWMSRYEASRLAPGQAVRTTRIAGTGYELRYNGERLAEASGAVIGQSGAARLCALVESLEPRPGIAPEPARGMDLTELLPFEVVLGKAKASLDQLSGLGRTSLIDLGIEAGATQEAELRVAGFSLAKGVVSVVGENMALRLTALSGGVGAKAPFRTTTALVDPSASPEKVKDYNFRMPDCFTKVQLEALAGLHGDFLRSLRALSAGQEGFPADMEIARVDQLNFTEFMDSLPEGELIVAAPASHAARPRLSEAEAPAKDFLDLSAKPAFPPEDAAAVSRYQRERPLGGAVLASGRLLESGRDSFFAALRDAWKNYGALSPYPDAEFRRSAKKPTEALSAYSGEYEMIALVTFRSGCSEIMNVAYPLRAIEPALKALGA